MEVLNPRDIFGGESIEEAAGIFLKVLQGKGTPAQENVVCANAALAIATAKEIDLSEAIAQAKLALDSGNALASFRKLQQLSA